MNTITLHFAHQRSTKNKELYQELCADPSDDVCGGLYLRRTKIGGTPPKYLEVTITEKALPARVDAPISPPMVDILSQPDLP